MLLSIIVPMYNVEKYLTKCIESVLSQEMSNYELILIDDCSTDSTLSCAKKYGDIKKVKIIEKKKNSGLSDTRNIGMGVACGTYILFLDSDDYIEEGALSTIQNIINEQRNPDVIYFGFYKEKEKEKSGSILYGYKSEKNHLYTGIEYAKNELQRRVLSPAACFGIYKREFLIANKLFFKVGTFHEDELWTPQVVMKADTIYVTDYAYYHYVKRDGSITTKKDKTQNGIDLVNICKELDDMFSNIEDSKLRRLLDNHIAMRYMKAVCYGKLFRKEKKQYVNRFYPIRKAYLPYEKVKAVLFAFSLRLYYLFDQMK